MSETLRQRLLAAVFDDEVIGDDLVRDVALSSETHGELVRLATVLAGLPGRGARAAEARLDSLLDQVSLIAASMSALARGSDVMRRFAEPPPETPADPGAPSDPPLFAGQSSVALPGAPRARPRSRVARTPVLVGAAAAAAILVGFLAWPERDDDEGSPPSVGVPVVRAPAAALRRLPDPEPPLRAATDEQAALVHIEILVNPSTATITIDGVAVDGNPFSGSRVSDGAIHRIGLRAPGYISKTVAVEFSAHVSLYETLDPAARAPVVGLRPPAPTRARPSPPRDPAVVADDESPPWLAGRHQAATVPVPRAKDVSAARAMEVPDPPSLFKARVQLRITTNVPGAEIAIDNTVVGTAPLREPLWVRPGRHTITVRHAGYVARTQFVDLDATNAGAIEIALPSSPPPEAIDATEGDPPVRPIDPVNPYVPDR